MKEWLFPCNQCKVAVECLRVSHKAGFKVLHAVLNDLEIE